MKLKVYHNGDDVFIAWKPTGIVEHCRGFALLRRRNGVEEVVSTWVGFADEDHEEGERRASINWPIQKYQWTDYMANPGDTLQYRVIPMIGPDKNKLSSDHKNASDWSEEFKLSHEVSPKMEVYFNRGIVASQWVSRRLGISDDNLQTKKLRQIIETPNDPFRNYLAGPLGERLFKLLADAAKNKYHVYGALYELDDKQLQDGLKKLKKHAHIVLANGSVKKVGEDQNADAREDLSGVVDLHDRMISPRALGHNKFLVVCDGNHSPRWVWTGSQNWTKTGLCTQANNSVLIDDHALAREYRKQWDLLKESGDETTDELKDSNTEPRDATVSGLPVRLWFTPTVGQVDLEEATALIENSKQSILFLMFNPGPKDTLLNAIVAKARKKAKKKLYVHGVVNQDPSTEKNPVELFDSANSEKADYEVVLPAAIDKTTAYWAAEMKKLPQTFAMVHSKVVLIDALGDNPIVMTGSHNLGPKASGINDENFLIIKDNKELASAYVTNIMAIYNQYRWRFRRHSQPKSKQWKGLEDGDTWQKWYFKKDTTGQREVNFWVGE
jgi:phosphatidylserine/phosphatidylglycerophosphate/cardiolipin synthase-like enzyme